jgi:hypothetical protein
MTSRVEQLAAELTGNDIKALARSRGWRVFEAFGRHRVQKTRRIPDTDGKPLRQAAMLIADTRRLMQHSVRWWEVYDAALKHLTAAHAGGQRYAYSQVLASIAGMIEPGAHETERGRAQLELAETIQNFIDRRRSTVEGTDAEPVQN